MDNKTIEQLNEQLKGRSAVEVVDFFLKNYKGEIALSSSLGLEDQVLTDMVCSIDDSTRIFTLDTGRIFPETYSLMARTNAKYGIKLEIFFPDKELVEAMVREHDINLFYNSVELRKKCCQVRKLEPLSRAFAGLKVWICGLRRSQSLTREGMRVVEWDSMNNMIKVNPLIEWSEEDCWQYVEKHGVPYNKLHKQGFPSIGCQPCTRAIESGEDIRAGRWWWESPEQKECGLHKR